MPSTCSTARPGKPCPPSSRKCPQETPISLTTLLSVGVRAGCVISSRLTKFLPNKQVLIIEASPCDFLDKRISDLKHWIDLLGTKFDYNYGITEQARGKKESSFIAILA